MKRVAHGEPPKNQRKARTTKGCAGLPVSELVRFSTTKYGQILYRTATGTATGRRPILSTKTGAARQLWGSGAFPIASGMAKPLPVVDALEVRRHVSRGSAIRPRAQCALPWKLSGIGKKAASLGTHSNLASTGGPG